MSEQLLGDADSPTVAGRIPCMPPFKVGAGSHAKLLKVAADAPKNTGNIDGSYGVLWNADWAGVNVFCVICLHGRASRLFSVCTPQSHPSQTLVSLQTR